MTNLYVSNTGVFQLRFQVKHLKVRTENALLMSCQITNENVLTKQQDAGKGKQNTNCIVDESSISSY